MAGDSTATRGAKYGTTDHIGAPKTEAREAGVYVIGLLREILAKYKTQFPPVGDGWMFRGKKMLIPIRFQDETNYVTMMAWQDLVVGI
jgi:hypothetical protein